MQPLDDEGLSQMLSEWRAPRAPDSLEARLSKEKGRRWWWWFVRGRIQVPVPVAAAALVALVIWASITPYPEVSAEPQPGVGFSGFQLADDLNPRIIRSTHEND